LSNDTRTLHTRVLDYIRYQKMWDEGQSVVLSVSGGVDSVVLLDLIYRTNRAHKGDLRVVTFNHGIRQESVDEVAFVHELAKAKGVPCEVYELKLKEGSHLQERARDARREVLAKYSNSKVATGHHQNDQAETVLYRLLRGTGLSGLKAMLPCQGMFVRPLLFVPKSELVAYANEHQLSWLDDPSNQKTARGKIRELFPLMEKIRPNPSSTLARNARLFARDEDYLQLLTEDKFKILYQDGKILLSEIQSQHHSIQLRLIRRLAIENELIPSAKQLEAFLQWEPIDGSRLPLSKGLSLVCTDKYIQIE
jgi:tRNA(Ile)-lysidine synthase